MKAARQFVKRLIRGSRLPVLLKEKLLFYLKLRYWPNFESPRSFTEKLHFRKLYETDQRMIDLSDKYLVRNYVDKKVGSKYLVPLLFQGEILTPSDLLAAGDDIVVKRNDDCGSVRFIDKCTPEMAESVCKDINRKQDYGQSTNEWWYSEIKPRILIEKRLREPEEAHPVDYKFFVFDTGSDKYVFLETIRRRADGKCECGFYDTQMQPLYINNTPVEFADGLPFSGALPDADTYAEMVEVSLKLSEGFNFMRVDLYSIAGKVYFGEMTFCPSEGRPTFTPREFDFELGKKWQQPVLLGLSPQFANIERTVCSY